MAISVKPASPEGLTEDTAIQEAWASAADEGPSRLETGTSGRLLGRGITRTNHKVGQDTVKRTVRQETAMRLYPTVAVPSASA